MSSVVQNIKIDQIDFDLSMQSRAKMDESVIAEYAEAITEGAKFPPITVFHDSATYWLADGFHRYFAHKKIGALDINADVAVGTKRDATLYSCGANAEHGLRRTDADKRRAILRMLEDEEWGKWSNREIARHCGVHPTTVSRVKEDVAAFYRGEGSNEGGKYRPGREVVFNSSAVMKIPTVHVDSDDRTYTTKHGTEAVMKTANIGKRPAARKVPAKRTLDQARPTDIPEESRADELNDARYTITELAEEADELRDRLAVAAMDATDEEKLLAQTTIAELRGRVRTLEAELDAARSMRDSLLVESAEKTKQILYWRKKAEKVAA